MRTLWQVSNGVGLSNADSCENITSFLKRNPGLNFVAYDGEQLVGTILCGHDGRRGYLYHLAVWASHQRRGIGRDLADRALSVLYRQKIDKCHIFVFKENQEAIAFWKHIGWTERIELIIMSTMTSEL